MLRMNYWAILVAALAAFVASSAWYIAFGKILAQVSPAFAGHLEEGASWRQPVVIVQGLVLAVVLTRLARVAGVTDWIAAVRLAIWLWIGFVGVQWVGALMWENVPWKVAAIHAGDWLIKVLIIAGIVGVWPPR